MLYLKLHDKCCFPRFNNNYYVILIITNRLHINNAN